MLSTVVLRFCFCWGHLHSQLVLQHTDHGIQGILGLFEVQLLDQLLAGRAEDGRITINSVLKSGKRKSSSPLLPQTCVVHRALPGSVR